MWCMWFIKMKSLIKKKLLNIDHVSSWGGSMLSISLVSPSSVLTGNEYSLPLGSLITYSFVKNSKFEPLLRETAVFFLISPTSDHKLNSSAMKAKSREIKLYIYIKILLLASFCSVYNSEIFFLMKTYTTVHSEAISQCWLSSSNN